MSLYFEKETNSDFRQRNDSRNTAENIGNLSGSSPSTGINVTGANVGAYSSPWDAVDFYQFNLTRQGTILMDPSTHLVNVELFDSNGNLVSKSLNGQPTRSRVLQPGTYYVAATPDIFNPPNGPFDPIGGNQYYFSLNLQPFPDDDDDDDTDPDPTTPVPDEVKINAASWTSDGQGGFKLSGNTQVGDYSRNIWHLVLDINGDGKDDLVELWTDNGISNAASWISDGQGEFTLSGNTRVGHYRPDTEYLVLDINGDGKDDLVEQWNDGGISNAASWISNGQGGFKLSGNTQVGAHRDDTEYLVLDINGDGKDDLVEQWNDGGISNAASWISNGQGGFKLSGSTRVGHYRRDTKHLVLDINGDGKNDLVEQWNDGRKWNAASWISDGQGGFKLSGNTQVGDFRPDTDYLVLDINGDGKDDLVERWNDSRKWNAASWISDGQGGFILSGNTQVGNLDYLTGHLVLDINGDGKDDLIEQWVDRDNRKWNAASWISDGQGGFILSGNTQVGDYDDYGYLVLDFNGDGKDDLIKRRNSSKTNSNTQFQTDSLHDNAFAVATDAINRDVASIGNADVVDTLDSLNNNPVAVSNQYWIQDAWGIQSIAEEFDNY